MPLSFFPHKLGASNSLRVFPAVPLAPLFLIALLGAPNYWLGLSLTDHLRQLPYGSRRWTTNVPSGSSFPPVVSGAKRLLDVRHICTAVLPRNPRRDHVS